MPNLPEPLRGCKVFPCLPGDKVPAIKNGWHDATDDSEVVAAWQAQGGPDLNWAVACGPSGLFVFDIDPNGIEAWRQLQEADPALKDAVARSFTVRTPRGGYHHYFRGQGPTTASRIAEGIDTRGGYIDEETGKLKSGGYVVLPGSRTKAGPKTVDGVYELLGGEILPLPPAAIKIIPERKKGTTHGLDRPPELDQPRNVQWAKDLLTNYVREGRVSVAGAGGNNTAFQVAASILDKAISPALTFELMDELWNGACSPPWEDWELETIVRNAAVYSEEGAKGAKGFQDNASAFEKFAGMETPPDDPPKRKGRFVPMRLADARKDVRPASWLVPGFIPSQGIGILYGLSGSYKTFVALDWALSLAHGVSGQWGTPPVKHKVLFLAGESAYALQEERVNSWCEWQNLDPEDAEFVLVRGVPGANDSEGWEEIRQGLVEMDFRPEFIVIDTLTRLMTGFDENSNNDAKQVLKLCEEMADHYGAFVLATGHTGKDQSRGIRGAQVFVDNCDSVIFSKATAEGTSLTVKKLKEVDIPEKPFYLEKKKFGDSIVLVRTENAPAVAVKANGSKISWSDPNEITRVLADNGGKLSIGMLVAHIAGATGVDYEKVRKELRTRQDIQWLRDGEDWRVPTSEMEFDI